MSWPLVKLGEVAPSKALKNPVVVDDDNVWQLNLDMVESGSGRVLKKSKAPLSEAGSSTHWFDDRNVLYSKLRPYLNKVVLPDEEGLATTELVPMLPDPKRLDRRYLVHYLRSKQFVSWISDQVAGAKMPRVSMKVFWDHEIPLPPVEEQKRIAAILDKADAIRQKRKQAIDLADEFLRSVFLDMFGDIPAGYSKYPLVGCRGSVKAASGKSSKGVISDSSTDIPVYGGNGINGYAIEALYSKPVVIVGRVGQQCGITTLSDGPCWVTDNAIVLEITDPKKYDAAYLAHALKHSPLRDSVKRLDLPFVNQSMILDYKIPLPPISEQKKFGSIRKNLLKHLFLQQKGIGMSEDNFQVLSQKAFSGQL